MKEMPSTNAIDAVDRFIARLYRSGLSVAPESFREWALKDWQTILPFDGAIWGTGTVRNFTFHTTTLVGLAPEFPRVLEETYRINPIVPRILSSLDIPVDMRDVMPDEQFFESEIHEKCFGRFGISRILSTGHVDARSGLYSLVTLYRNDRRRPFTDEERCRQKRAAFHLFDSASHAFFLHLLHSHQDRPTESAAGAVDSEGILHEVSTHFTAMLDRFFPNRTPEVLPFPLPQVGETEVSPEGLCIRTEALADLRLVFIWPAGPLDRLTSRERQIVYAVAHGLSFKQAARRIGIAPSTVANHLYRIYRKLGVYSRSELATLVYPIIPK